MLYFWLSMILVSYCCAIVNYFLLEVREAIGGCRACRIFTRDPMMARVFRNH